MSRQTTIHTSRYHSRSIVVTLNTTRGTLKMLTTWRRPEIIIYLIVSVSPWQSPASPWTSNEERAPSLVTLLLFNVACCILTLNECIWGHLVTASVELAPGNSTVSPKDKTRRLSVAGQFLFGDQPTCCSYDPRVSYSKSLWRDIFLQLKCCFESVINEMKRVYFELNKNYK